MNTEFLGFRKINSSLKNDLILTGSTIVDNVTKTILNNVIYLADDDLNIENGEAIDSLVQKVTNIDPTDIDENGNLNDFINTSTGENSVTFGKSNKNKGNHSLVAGKLNINEGINNLVVGLHNAIRFNNLVISGCDNVIATHEEASTMRYFENLHSDNLILSGHNNKVYSYESLIAGSHNTIYGARSAIVGYGNNSLSNDSFIGGRNNNVRSSNVFLAGNNNNVEAAYGNNLIIGSELTLSLDETDRVVILKVDSTTMLGFADYVNYDGSPFTTNPTIVQETDDLGIYIKVIPNWSNTNAWGRIFITLTNSELKNYYGQGSVEINLQLVTGVTQTVNVTVCGELHQVSSNQWIKIEVPVNVFVDYVLAGKEIIGNNYCINDTWGIKELWLRDITISEKYLPNTTYGYSLISGVYNNIHKLQASAISGAHHIVDNLNYSILGGQYNTVSGNNNLIAGSYLNVTGDNKTVIGKNNKDVENALFIIGNGDSTYGRKNAFEVLKDGRAKVFGTPTEDNDVVRKIDLQNISGGGTQLYQHSLHNPTDEAHTTIEIVCTRAEPFTNLQEVYEYCPNDGQGYSQYRIPNGFVSMYDCLSAGRCMACTVGTPDSVQVIRIYLGMNVTNVLYGVCELTHGFIDTVTKI